MNIQHAWEYLSRFDPKPDEYTRHNLKRYLKVIKWLPDKKLKVLDLGSERFFVMLLTRMRSQYEVYASGLEVAIGAPQESSRIDLIQNQLHAVSLKHFNVEKDRFPYEDEEFDLVLCLELIEHLRADPAHMMKEINRVLKPEGSLMLTTPNIISWKNIFDAIGGIYPMEWIRYQKGLGFTQHVREYMPFDIKRLMEESGFFVTRLKTYSVTQRRLTLLQEILKPVMLILIILMARHPKHLFNRNPKIFALGSKTASPQIDAGGFLYS